MRILLDHCVPKRLRRSLFGHDTRTSREMRWETLRNGNLLAQAARQFDVLITVDRNIQRQQNLSALPIAVVVLVGKSNKLADLIPLVPELLQSLSGLHPGTLTEIVG